MGEISLGGPLQLAFRCEQGGRGQMSVLAKGEARRQAAKRILAISRKIRVSCHLKAGGGPPGTSKRAPLS